MALHSSPRILAGRGVLLQPSNAAFRRSSGTAAHYEPHQADNILNFNDREVSRTIGVLAKNNAGSIMNMGANGDTTIV